MENISSINLDGPRIKQLIFTATTQDDPRIRKSFLTHFSRDVENFVNNMTAALMDWFILEKALRDEEKKYHIAALVYSSINLHVISMKLFLSGYLVPAGNVQRQVLETMALAILCADKTSNVLDRYIANQYSTNKALDDVIKRASTLNLNHTALKALKEARNQYHIHSHPSFVTIASNMSIEREGGIYLGESFDDGKLREYKIEINNRLRLSSVFRNFITAVSLNVKS